MNAGFIILRVAFLGRRDAQKEYKNIYKRDDDDAQNERDGAAAAQLRRSNSSVAVQHYNLALKWSSHRRVPFRAAAPR